MLLLYRIAIKYFWYDEEFIEDFYVEMVRRKLVGSNKNWGYRLLHAKRNKIETSGTDDEF